YAALEPVDLLNKHAWLFRDGWVEESADEIHGDEEIDFNKREERITALRTDALREVLTRRGVGGILELAERGKAAWQIGFIAANAFLPERELIILLRTALTQILAGQGELFSRKNLIVGVLRALGDEKREAVLRRASDGLSEDDAVQLFLLAPFCRSTWKQVDV